VHSAGYERPSRRILRPYVGSVYTPYVMLRVLAAVIIRMDIRDSCEEPHYCSLSSSVRIHKQHSSLDACSFITSTIAAVAEAASYFILAHIF
jgi:hypothetical protein